MMGDERVGVSVENDGGVVVTIRLPGVAGPLDADATRLLRLVRRIAARQVGGGVEPPVARGTPLLRVVPHARTVYCDGREIPLTRREFDLLRHLADHPRRVFTRAQLLDRVWGHPFTGARSVDVHVRRLRAKLGADLPVISTVRGVGYGLGSAVSVEVEGDPG
ncbi:winged helix-turn-helix domain-containing protein [Verrucosispora sp. WMMA2121]|nr:MULTISPECIES: winged helix-turn-helix domain-containing protein [unclassified Micromonospora]MCZ7418679.1 winged helix-turn-helix domain-containing protein [Verrucosispora sp. WMMA2121]WBB92381.1 winged helix-turn-helix domain-containing protein [Verrucosispora sp. WMMC514]